MADAEQLKIIKQGSFAWNAWQRRNPDKTPDLSDADLSETNLQEAKLFAADLRGAILTGADFSGANLANADLRGVDLTNAKLIYVDLSAADLSGADLTSSILRRANLVESNLANANLREAFLADADLTWADLREADLTGTYLRRVKLNGANLTRTDFSGAHLLGTTFANNDMSIAKGLHSVVHEGPSTIGVDTLFRSDGKIPDVFLRGAGIPEDFLTFLPSLLVGRAIQFYSCFISYSHQDEAFSQRLHSRMRSANLRVWYAPEDMKGGRKLHEEIFQAIQIHDKLLLVLSENSMKSEWVMSEIRRARKIEREEDRRKLFPIRLVDFRTIEMWECFDADSGKDLAIEVREYYIPDFSNWKDHDSFEAEFARLLRDLKATEH